MCGIAGTIALGEPTPRELLSRMAKALAHRGPDGEGIETIGPCSLVHRRLAILDLSEAGAQPMRREGAWVVFSGEIYDYVELREELAKLGHAFSTRTDTEVLLAAWKQWGREMLPRLNGMFAFAIWDEGKRELFLARDRFGEKPLFHAMRDGRFVFASELKAFAPLFKASVDESWVYRFLQFGHLEQGEESMLTGVKRLLPGHSMTVRVEGDAIVTRIDRWYSLPMAGGASDPNAAARFRERFDDAVRIRLRSDVPVGTSLSGGVDSGAIVTTVAAVSPADRHSFTCRMEDPRLDEGEFSLATARAAGVRVHEVTPTAADLARDFDALVAAQDEPFQSASLYAQWRTFQLAKQAGVTVLLDGQGADEILAGYPTFASVAAGERLARGRFAEARAVFASAPSNAGPRVRKEAREYAVRKLLGATLLRLIEAARMPRGAHSAALVSPEARKRFGRPARLRPSLNGRGWLDAWLRYATSEGPLQMLLRYADRNSMAHSREVRLPFLDPRVVEYCFSLADEWKIGGGYTKRVLREAMAGRVPDAVRLRREKVGFDAPDVMWLTGPLRDWTRERASAAISRFVGLVDTRRAHAALETLQPEHPDRALGVSTLFPWIVADASVRHLG